MAEIAADQRSSAAPPRIVFAGNIGTGKTTLAGAVALDLGAALFEESVEDNPYLERFYADMPRWAMHLNMYFLASRAEQLIDAEALRAPAVLDRSFYEDRVFVDVARQLGHTSEENYRMFDRMERVLARTLPRPTLLVYLSAPVSILMERIRARARPFETGLTSEYLTTLQDRYETWIDSYRSSPKITIRFDDLSDAGFITTQEVLSRVRRALSSDDRGGDDLGDAIR